MATSGRNRRQRRGIIWTAVGLAVIALAVYIGFILLTATQA